MYNDSCEDYISIYSPIFDLYFKSTMQSKMKFKFASRNPKVIFSLITEIFDMSLLKIEKGLKIEKYFFLIK